MVVKCFGLVFVHASLDASLSLSLPELFCWRSGLSLSPSLPLPLSLSLALSLPLPLSVCLSLSLSRSLSLSLSPSVCLSPSLSCSLSLSLSSSLCLPLSLTLSLSSSLSLPLFLSLSASLSLLLPWPVSPFLSCLSHVHTHARCLLDGRADRTSAYRHIPVFRHKTQTRAYRKSHTHTETQTHTHTHTHRHTQKHTHIGTTRAHTHTYIRTDTHTQFERPHTQGTHEHAAFLLLWRRQCEKSGKSMPLYLSYCQKRLKLDLLFVPARLKVIGIKDQKTLGEGEGEPWSYSGSDPWKSYFWARPEFPRWILTFPTAALDKVFEIQISGFFPFLLLPCSSLTSAFVPSAVQSMNPSQRFPGSCISLRFLIRSSGSAFGGPRVKPPPPCTLTSPNKGKMVPYLGESGPPPNKPGSVWERWATVSFGRSKRTEKQL